MQDLLSATLVLRDILYYLVKPVHLVLQIVPSAMSPEAESVTLALVSRDSILIIVRRTFIPAFVVFLAAKPAWTTRLVLHVSLDSP